MVRKGYKLNYPGFQERFRNQPSMYEQLEALGVCVDQEAAIQVTAFCWANGFDLAAVAFDIQVESGE